MNKYAISQISSFCSFICVPVQKEFCHEQVRMNFSRHSSFTNAIMFSITLSNRAAAADDPKFLEFLSDHTVRGVYFEVIQVL